MHAIDRDILREQMGGEADVDALLRELAPIFVDYSRACFEKLHAAATEGDLETIARLAHTLKGSAATLGAASLAECCAELQCAARSQNEEDATRSIERVTSSFEHVARELSDYM
jgi:HPt (histidine-containing phosphotransfer) domain-containing protein